MAHAGELSFGICRPTGVCAATGRKIEVGERYVAALVEREGEEDLSRLDFDHREWRRGARPKAPLRLFGSWTTTMAAPDTKKKLLLDDEALVELFATLEGVEEPRRVAFRYVLTLLLIRKRLLKYEETRKDHMGGRPVMVVKRSAGGRNAGGTGEWEVIDPGMDEPAVAAAIEELTAVMAGAEPAAR